MILTLIFRPLFIFFSCLVYGNFLYAQKDVPISQLDSLKHYTYKDLSGKFYDNETDSVLALVYAKAYLNRAKEDQDTIRMADGYYYLARRNIDSLAINYTDSIIALTKVMGNEEYPAKGYFLKGYIFGEKRNFRAALDSYLEASKYVKNRNNSRFTFVIKHNIGLLKSRMGENQEALLLFKECFNFYSQDSIKKEFTLNYLLSLFALADSHRRNHHLDTTSMFNQLGYQESILVDKSEMKNYFVLNEGVNLYFKKEYNVAIDSITRALTIMKKMDDKPNMAYSYFYLGKSYLKLGKTEEAIASLKMVDTIFQNIHDIHPDLREGYEILINHYKSIDDKEQQLLYTGKLLSIDSILHSNYRYISKNISQKYDTPQLISEKNKLIASLSNKKKWITVGGVGVSIIALGAIGLFYFYYKRQKVYQKRLKKLLKSESSEDKDILSEKVDRKKYTADYKEVPEEIRNNILNKLKRFEAEHKYLSKNLNLKDMARDLQTNTKYLSKTINIYKHKSFNTYINDLRIDYTVSKLKEDKKTRNYTIKAIAQEVGFNSSEPFSKAFYKRTGIYPSFLIKELKNKKVRI